MLKWINKKRNQKGFTLIELIVVIAILAILAVIAIPRLTGSRDKANRSAVLASLRSIESAISVAEAEGADVTKLKIVSASGDPADTVYLVDKYLAKEPKGPGDATYAISSGRATVTFAANKLFKFEPGEFSGEAPTSLSAGTAYLLENLKEPD